MEVYSAFFFHLPPGIEAEIKLPMVLTGNVRILMGTWVKTVKDAKNTSPGHLLSQSAVETCKSA